MSSSSNQPVRKRSAKLQAVIDLVKEEIRKGKSSAEIDDKVREYKLDKEEHAELIKDTFDYQLKAEQNKLTKQNLLTKLLIGAFIFLFGIYFLIISNHADSIDVFLAGLMILGGGIYLYRGAKDWISME